MEKKDTESTTLYITFGTLAKLVRVIDNFYCIAKFLNDRVFHCLYMKTWETYRRVPLNMQETNTTMSDPRFAISAALVIAFLPGQPPQVLIPIASMSSMLCSLV